MNTLKYKGFTGTTEFSAEDGVFFGRVLGVRSMISFAGDSVESLIRSFEDAVDGYLQTCEENGVAPEKPFSGTFNVRVGETAHRDAAIQSEITGVSMNEFVKRAIEREVQHCQLAANLPKSVRVLEAKRSAVVTFTINEQNDPIEDAMLRGPSWQDTELKIGRLQ